jgi:hypothetical protein
MAVASLMPLASPSSAPLRVRWGLGVLPCWGLGSTRKEKGSWVWWVGTVASNYPLLVLGVRAASGGVERQGPATALRGG